MERLPLLAMEVMCQYLSMADLIACSAVSRGWRAVFNEDRLWRPHCEPDLEEALRTTPPTVRQDSTIQEFDEDELDKWLLTGTCTEFTSNSPQTDVTGLEESTNLEPLCHWRQALIRQNSLINNWKHIRFSRSEVTLDCMGKSCDHKAKFITDDIIFVTCSSIAEITLWNVKSHPSVKCAGSSYRKLPYALNGWQIFVDQSGTQVYLDNVRKTKGIPFQEKDPTIKSVDIFHFDLNAMTLELCYIFTAEEFMSEIEGAANRNNVIVCEKLIHKCCVAEHLFLVAFAETPGASEIHIWDLRTGEKIKTVPLPMNAYFHRFEVAGQDVLVVSVYYKDTEDVYFYEDPKVGGYRYNIFNTQLLGFLSFTAERQLMINEHPYWDKFSMIENFLIIPSVLRDNSSYTFKIFKYKTNDLIHESPGFSRDSDDGYLCQLADGFIYVGRTCKPFVLFDPRDETVLTLADSGSDLDMNVLRKVWLGTEDSIKKIFLFKHVLFSNVSQKTINDLFEVINRFHMNPSFHVGVHTGYRSNVFSIIRFW